MKGIGLFLLGVVGSFAVDIVISNMHDHIGTVKDKPGIGKDKGKVRKLLEVISYYVMEWEEIELKLIIIFQLLF